LTQTDQKKFLGPATLNGKLDLAHALGLPSSKGTNPTSPGLPPCRPLESQMGNIKNEKKKLLKKGGTHGSVVKQQSHCLLGAKEGEIWG